VPPLLVLIGPTAAGKSTVALDLAPRLDAEVISLDSMLVYRGLDIATDKPRDLRGVPHHLLDTMDPADRFDVRHYLAQADAAIDAIHARGRRALVVGGTGLYLMGLLKGVFEGVPRDPDLRERLGGRSPADLHGELRRVDPRAAERIHPNDRRRLIRALEVHAATGKPLDEMQKQFDGPDRYAARIAGLRWPRPALYARIRARVERMLADGLVDEIRALAPRLGPTAAQAVGAKEVRGYLEGRWDLAEARRLIESHTVQLVRRQETWFRRFRVHWVDGASSDRDERLLAFYRGSISE